MPVLPFRAFRKAVVSTKVSPGTTEGGWTVIPDPGLRAGIVKPKSKEKAP